MIPVEHQPKIGTTLVALGAGMLVTSFALAMVFGVAGAVLHNTLQLGGVALLIVGYLFHRGVFMGGDDAEDSEK